MYFDRVGWFCSLVGLRASRHIIETTISYTLTRNRLITEFQNEETEMKMGYNDSARPPECRERHLRFLDRLRRAETTDMKRSHRELAKRYGLGRTLSLFILKYWIATYSERHHGQTQH